MTRHHTPAPEFEDGPSFGCARVVSLGSGRTHLPIGSERNACSHGERSRPVDPAAAALAAALGDASPLPCALAPADAPAARAELPSEVAVHEAHDSCRVRLGIYAHALAAEVEFLRFLGGVRDAATLAAVVEELRGLVRRMMLRGVRS